MKRIALQNNTVNSYHSLQSDREYALEICEELGRGATCMTYRVRDKSTGLPYILKECFPLHNARRSSSGEIVWENDAAREIGESKITKAYEIQKRLQSDGETANDTVHLTDGLLSANNTLYMLIDPRNAETYDRVNDGSVQDTYKTAKAIARAVGAQHRLGYLNLDIKPENILVYPQTREMVMLLDFDSLVKKTSLTGSESISYSVRYAAPEQLQGSRRKICEATDIYAVGAVVFERIFGKTPEACDRSVFSDWDLSACKAFDRLSGKAERLTKEFLKKTLSADISYRYQNTDELAEALDELITECGPKRRHLNSTVMASPNHFVGRKNEISQISNILSSEGCQRAFLRGIGGIGKTEIALRYAALAANDYDTICFGRYSDSLANLFCDDGFISIENNSETGLGFKALDGLTDSRTLLIIDNLDTLDDPDMDRLLGLNCKMLITSRCDFSELYPAATHIDVHELDPDEQKALFIHRLENSGSDFNQKTVEEILRVIQGYTLLIPLIADVYRRGTYTLEEIAAKIRDSGVGSIPDDKVRIFKDTQLSSSAFNILCSVLDMSSFSTEERYVMDSISLLNGVQYDRKQLLDWIGREYNNALNGLAEMGWLQSRGAGPFAVFTTHGIICQTYLKKYKPSAAGLQWFRNFCKEYIAECRTIMDGLKTATADAAFDGIHNSKKTIYYCGRMDRLRCLKKYGLIFAVFKKMPMDEKEILFSIETLTEICNFSISNAVNFIFAIPSYYTDILEEDSNTNRIAAGMPANLTESFWYLAFLINLKVLLDFRTDDDIVSESISGSMRSNDSSKLEITAKVILAANRFLSNKSQKDALLKILNPCIDAGTAKGRHLFKTEDDWGENDETAANLFSLFVEKTAKQCEQFLNDEEQKEFAKRIWRFREEMSLDSFYYDEDRIEEDRVSEAQASMCEGDYVLDKLKYDYEKATDSEKARKYAALQRYILAEKCRLLVFKTTSRHISKNEANLSGSLCELKGYIDDFDAYSAGYDDAERDAIKMEITKMIYSYLSQDYAAALIHLNAFINGSTKNADNKLFIWKKYRYVLMDTLYDLKQFGDVSEFKRLAGRAVEFMEQIYIGHSNDINDPSGNTDEDLYYRYSEFLRYAELIEDNARIDKYSGLQRKLLGIDFDV